MQEDKKDIIVKRTANLELDGIDDDNIYKVERVVEERVIHVYIIINIDQS